MICYINAGAYENFRPDHASFPSSILGKSDGWAGERWLDIRRLSVIQPIMARRFDMCRGKGFDAVEPDNLEAYDNNSGFPVTAAQQLAFNRMIAKLAHDRSMSVGLKNDLSQAGVLAPAFDFAVNEQCFQYSECSSLRPFLAAGKAVFNAEYSIAPKAFCGKAKALGVSAMRKHLSLDAWRQAC